MVDELSAKIRQLDKQIERENKRERAELEEDHEAFAAILLDLKSDSNNPSVNDQLVSLENTENESRHTIRRKFRDRTDALRLQRHQIEEEIGHHRPLVSTVRKLNDNILIEVFTLYVDPASDTGLSPWVLAHVNRPWRALVLSSETLWSGILITTNVDEKLTRRMRGKEVCNSPARLRRALERVKRVPIDLVIALNWSNDLESALRCWPHKILDADVAAEMIIHVCKTSAQWRRIHVENSQKIIPDDYVFPPDLFAHGLPMLTSASFQMQHWVSAMHSRGLVPFRGILDAIERTSKEIKLIRMHGAGHRDTYEYYDTRPVTIRHATLVRGSPQEVKKVCSDLLGVWPDSDLVRHYAPLFLDDQHQAREISRLSSKIPTTLQIFVSLSFETSLSSLRLEDLQVIDLVSQDGLHLTQEIELPNLERISLLSGHGDIRNIRLLRAPRLGCLAIVLTDNSEEAICASRTALEDLWDRNSTSHWKDVQPKEIRLRGVGVSSLTLRSLAMTNPRHIAMNDIHFDTPDAILGLAEANTVEKLEVELSYSEVQLDMAVLVLEQNRVQVQEAQPLIDIKMFYWDGSQDWLYG